MTGHGHIVTDDYGKVQWEFRNMICRSSKFPDLKVEERAGYLVARTLDADGVNSHLVDRFGEEG